MELSKTWTEIKELLLTRHLKLQYEHMADTPERYSLYAVEGAMVYKCLIKTGSAEFTEFVDNYKAISNKPIEDRNGDGRAMLVATSRPHQCTTYFTSSGDDIANGVIGEGDTFFYDFSDTEHNITEGVPVGYKRKQIDFRFIDSAWIKEGTIYFHNAVKKSYVDLFVVCPQGYPYFKNDKTFVQAAPQETIIEHFVNKLYVQGSCPMGDELNTESASEEIPPFYFFRMWITVPDSDTESNGYINLELFRERTVVLD